MKSGSTCARRFKWAGGESDFDLGHERVLKVLGGDLCLLPFEFLARGYPIDGSVLKGQFGNTPAACLKRFDQAVYSIKDVERVIELGLWGGGMRAADVINLSDRFVRGKPLVPSASLAFEILAALFVEVAENANASA